MRDKLKNTDFSPYINQKFRIHLESSQPLEAELVEVTEHEPKSEDKTKSSERASFSIVFRCAQDNPLQQMIYKVEHDKMGTLELFLVPIGPDEKGLQQYEAVFN